MRALAGPWSLLRSSEAEKLGRARTWHGQDVGSKRSSRPNRKPNVPDCPHYHHLNSARPKPHRELPLSSRPKRLRSSAHVIGTRESMLVALLYDAILDMLRGRAGLRRSVNAHKQFVRCAGCYGPCSALHLSAAASFWWLECPRIMADLHLLSGPHDTLHGSRFTVTSSWNLVNGTWNSCSTLRKGNPSSWPSMGRNGIIPTHVDHLPTYLYLPP